MTALPIAIQVAAALIFLEAAVGKFRDWDAFEGVVAGYDLGPEWAQMAVARLLPPVETILAALLFVGVLAQWAAWFAAILFAVFAGAMAINLVRGRTTIDCGCGRPGQPLTWGRVAKNLCLALALVAAQAFNGPADLPQWSLGLAAGVAIFLVDYAHSLLSGLGARRAATS